MARHADMTRLSDLDQIAAAAAPALFDLADAAPVAMPDPGRADRVPAATPSQIVLIGANVPDVQDLVDGLRAGVAAVLLNPDQDGVQQIAAYVTSHNVTNLTGIDLFDLDVNVGTIDVGTSLSISDFIVPSDGSADTDVVVDAIFGACTGGVTLLVNPTTITSAATIGGSASNAVGVIGPAGTAWTLANQGRVSETGRIRRSGGSMPPTRRVSRTRRPQSRGYDRTHIRAGSLSQ
jgi:hypothetical protein